MRTVSEDADGVTLRLSQTEFRIVNNSLNEVTNGTKIPEWEFEDRLGGPRGETRGLLNEINGRQSIGPDGLTVRLSSFDLVLLRNAMVEMTNGVEIEEWEYPIRLGATVAQGKQLLGEIEGQLDGMSHSED